MLGDSTDEIPVSNSAVFIYVENADETYKKAMDKNSISLLEPQDMHWGARGAGFMDPYGNTWWINTLAE
jgi:PhnB protein